MAGAGCGRHVSAVSDRAPESVTIRHCATAADYAAVYALQAETWGREAAVLVCTPILKVAQRTGGITAGAFDADGRLLGFVFGLTGPQGGRLVHWSDMLAVRPEVRDMGLGRRLKAFQRDACRAMGVAAIQWTYDPLVARNAHLNLARLGARPVEYVVDMYADSDSPLHTGIGTDRFVVEWPVTDAPPASAPLVPDPCPILTDGPHLHLDLLAERLPLVAVRIPDDIHAVAAADLSHARQWRTSTRTAFQAAFAAGYRCVDFITLPGGRAYLLQAPPSAAHA